jgi:N-acetylglucosamine malate deacetylase 1
MARIIIFGPHPDDQEIGMGASIAKLAALGHEVLIVDVTDGSPTPRGDRASRMVEAQAALAALQPGPDALARGAKPINRVLLDLPNRMVEHTLNTRHIFAGAIRAHQASIVFTPWTEDAHPDHRAVTRSVEDARFDAKLTKIDMPTPRGFSEIGPPIYPKWLFYYHVSHLRATITPNFLLDVTGYEQQKIASVRAYRSQFGPWDDAPAGTPPVSGGSGATHASFSPGDPKSKGGPMESIRDSSRGRLVSVDLPERLLAYSAYMGSLIGVAHAEPFMTKEPIGIGDLAALIS